MPGKPQVRTYYLCKGCSINAVVSEPFSVEGALDDEIPTCPTCHQELSPSTEEIFFAPKSLVGPKT